MISGIVGIIALSAAYIGYFKTKINLIGKILLTIGGLLLVSSKLPVILVGTVLVLIVLLPKFLRVDNLQSLSAGNG